MAPVANFDRIARAYRSLEYLSLGTLLERTRFEFLRAGRLDGCRRALVLGDGDGRFTARLLERNGQVRVTAVDASGEMLRLLWRRCARHQDRLEIVQSDVLAYRPEPEIDLVVTHFLLDCLTNDEVDHLVGRVRAATAHDALWLVSEFCVPGGWLRRVAGLLVRGLYLAFRVLTGLQVTRLPDYARALRRHGFEVAAQRTRLAGLLVAELWVSKTQGREL